MIDAQDDFLSLGPTDEPAAPAVHTSKGGGKRVSKQQRDDQEGQRLEAQRANIEQLLDTIQEEQRQIARDEGKDPNDVHAQLNEFLEWDKNIDLRDKRFNLIKHVFPDEDIWGRNPETGKPFIVTHSRHKYKPQMRFFATKHKRRLFRAANRSGKSFAGAFETALHVTGAYNEYAPWWPGYRLTNPVRPNGTMGPIEAQAVGVSADSMIRSIQKELLGNPAVTRKGLDGSSISGDGTGLLPRSKILATMRAAGVPMGVSTVLVEHTNSEGMPSIVHFKASEAGAGKFAGTTRSLIWGDEEIDMAVWAECLQRLATTQGIAYLTVTPLNGLTPLMVHLDPSLAPEPTTGATGTTSDSSDQPPDPWNLDDDEAA